MKKSLVIISLAAWWHFLIWEASLGLNALLFSVSITAAVAWLKPQAWSRRVVKSLLVAWCITGFWVFWHHTDLSTVVFWLLAFLCMGYLQDTPVKFWGFGLIESIRALFGGWWLSILSLGKQLGTQYPRLPSWQKVRIFVLPLLVVTPFYLIYSEANTTLGEFNQLISGWLDTALQLELDWSRFFVFLLGWVFVLAFLGQRIGLTSLHQWAEGWTFELQRRRQLLWPVKGKTLGLKQEFQSALLTFTALNILVGIINGLDLIFVWFSRQERSAAELSAYVHEGTWLLIFSILLAMLVVIGFFRGNLNFMTNNQRLRQLAYLWLGQNAFLALSVGVRNGHYIHRYALAEGRIVVIFFLALVLFGLLTLYRKVKEKKTIFYLLQTNAAAVVIALVLAASCNWSNLITRYNLRQENPDLYYLVGMLDHNLPPLLKIAEGNTMLADKLNHQQLERKGRRLSANWEAKDWRGWNWREYRQYQAWQRYLKIEQ